MTLQPCPTFTSRRFWTTSTSASSNISPSTPTAASFSSRSIPTRSRRHCTERTPSRCTRGKAWANWTLTSLRYNFINVVVCFLPKYRLLKKFLDFVSWERDQQTFITVFPHTLGCWGSLYKNGKVNLNSLIATLINSTKSLMRNKCSVWILLFIFSCFTIYL